MSKPKTLYIGSVNNGVHTLVTPILGRVLETLHDMVASGQADWKEIHQEVNVAPYKSIATFTEVPRQFCTGTVDDMHHIVAAAREAGWNIEHIECTVPHSNHPPDPRVVSPTIEEFCSHIGLEVPAAILSPC